MLYQKPNVDYIQLCKALEERNKVAAQNLIINNSNVNDPHTNEMYNWVVIIYEALDVSVIIFCRKLNQNADVTGAQLDSKLHDLIVKDLHYWHDEMKNIRKFSEKFKRLFMGKLLPEENKETTLNVILNNGNDNCPNASNVDNWATVISEIVDITIRLLDKGADTFARNDNNYKLLNDAVQKNNTLEACLRIRKGAFREEDLNVLLLKAIEQKNDTIAKMLIDHSLFLNYNANIQYVSPDGNTPLHKAIENDFDVEFIKNLLKLNSSVDAVNHEMLTPLLIACKTKSENQLDIVEALVQYNANVNCADLSLMTPLHFACQVRNLDVVTVLLKQGANPNVKNHTSRTPLHVVCRRGESYFARKDKNDETPSIIQLLLKHNADIEAVDSKGWTPLCVACKAGRIKVVQCLLNNHANVNHTDLENLNPLYIAAQYSFSLNAKVLELLLEHKINVHCINKLGKSIIHFIVERHSEELIKSLFNTQINFNSVDNKENTPLYIAVKTKSLGMTKNLLKYGADINILDKKKRTPLRKAIENVSYHRKKLEDHNFIHQWYKSEWNSDVEDGSNLPAIIYAFNHIHPYKRIIRILKMHIVKLKVAGLRINKQNSHLFYSSHSYAASDDESSDEEDVSDIEDSKTDVLQLEVKCTQEIERMKMETIGVNDMTFYDLLTKNIHLLSRWVKNKKILKISESQVYHEKFPLYIHIFRSRFRDAKFRHRLMNPAKKYFSLNICQRLPDDCIDTVFSYLKIKDIHMFIRAMKSLDG